MTPAHEIISYLPLLNFFLLPLVRSIMRIGKRIDTIEFNQRRLCSKIEIDYIEVKT
jgi:hypothetical protein